MKVRVVPSSVTDGAGRRAFYLSSYVIDEAVAIDAGGLGLLGDIDAMLRVTDVFLTHSHADHIASLPIFLETVFDSGRAPVTIHASDETLDCLRRDVFNDRVWPDFVGMSDRGLPFLRLQRIETERPVDLHGLRFTPVLVDHVVPTHGFIIEGPGVAIAMPSDTGPTYRFWDIARSIENLRAVFLEASFPASLTWLAKLSKHLTAESFADEAAKLGRHTRFIAVHIKPRFYDEVVAELNAIQLAQGTIEIAQPDAVYEFV